MHYSTKNINPLVNYDNQKNILFIKENSYGHHVSSLYEDIDSMIDQHYISKDILHVYLFFNTINNLTVKPLFNIFEKLNSVKTNSKNVKITWFSDPTDPDMMDIANGFNQFFEFNASIIPV